MAVLTTGNTFSNGDQVTASSLNNAVNDAEFAAGAVDGISTQKSGSGAIIVKDLGISRGKIAIDAVGTDQLANDVVISTSGSITGAAGSFTTLSASGDVNFDSNTLFVDASTNNVGIGTTTPQHKLDIRAESDAAISTGLLIANTASSSEGTGTAIRMVHSTSQTSNSASTISSERAASNGSIIGLNLSTDGSAVPSRVMTLLGSNGNVGIGTSSPSYKLDVNGTGRFTSTVRFDGQTQNYNGAYDIYRSGAGYFRHRIADQSLYLGVTNTAGTVHYPIVMSPVNDSLVFNNEEGEMARFDTSGNLGIGTSSPSSTLHVENTTSSGAYINYDGQSNTEFGLRIESNAAGGNFEGDFANNGSLLDLFANSSVTSGGDILACRTQSATPVMLVRGNGNVGIGTASPSAPLTVTSTTGGVLMPRMTTTQMNAISSPANGEMIYNTTDNKFYGYANGAWVALH